jgi:hypothetical protein
VFPEIGIGTGWPLAQRFGDEAPRISSMGEVDL